MDILNLMLAIAEPNGMWESIIKWIQSGVGNYAVTIILLTIGIKVLLLPLDFYQKYVSKVNGKKQAKLQPEIDKINAKYGNGSCVAMVKICSQQRFVKPKNYGIIQTRKLQYCRYLLWFIN